MISLKTKEQPQRDTVASKSPSGKVAMMPDPVLSQDKIRTRAYELYENRGCEPGQDQQDWIRAEQDVLFDREK
jgi:hypothetical protein